MLRPDQIEVRVQVARASYFLSNTARCRADDGGVARTSGGDVLCSAEEDAVAK
jgi:hypothetical protein